MNCQFCCFYREIKLPNKRLRRLCMLTGEKRPEAGMSGCSFVAGQWDQLDRILGLPKSRIFGNTSLPNQVKPGNGFSRNGRKFADKDILAIDNFFGKQPISYITGKGSLVRPGYREAPVAHLARERTGCLFRV